MVDILAIGAHPDDVELSCSGTLLRQRSIGSSVAIVDLSQGELGTRGNGEIRLEEARSAARVLGISDRSNLGFRDGFITDDEEHIARVVELIRLKKPRIILCNATDDRHPDHKNTASLIKKACFYSGLVKYETSHEGEKQESWLPENLFHYIQFKYISPDFVVDISEFFETKMKAIKAFKSQFYDPDSNEPESFISTRQFLEFVECRMVEFGRIIGVNHAEGFTTARIPGIANLFDIK